MGGELLVLRGLLLPHTTLLGGLLVHPGGWLGRVQVVGLLLDRLADLLGLGPLVLDRLLGPGSLLGRHAWMLKKRAKGKSG